MEQRLTDDQHQRLIDAVEHLDVTIQGFSNEVKGMKSITDRLSTLFQRQRRRFVFAAVLLVAVAGLGVWTNATSRANHANLVAACQAGDRTRTGNEALWDYAVVTLAGSNPGPKTQATEQQALARVSQTFQQVDCSKL